MFEKLKRWAFSLQGKFILVASACILVFTTIGSLIILSREEKLYRQDLINQGSVLSEISRLTLTNVMVYNELGMMDKHDLIDYLDYFIMNLMERDKRVRSVMILDNEGGVLAHSNITESSKVYIDEPLWKAIASLEKAEITEGSFQKEPVLKITAPLNINTKRWGVIRVDFSMKELQDNLASLKKELYVLIVLFSLLSFVVLSIGANVLSKPVIRLARMMDGIKTHGDIEQQSFDFRDRRDELGKLQKSFLWMIQRLIDAGRERKKTIEVLSQTEKMVSIGRLASGVAHEINNPLSGIALCFKNLIESNVDNQTEEKLIMAINDGLQKIKNIVQQLLDFSRMTVTEKKPADLNSFIDRLLVLLNYPASKKHIRIVKDLAVGVPEVLIDENKMSQVFMNIMINALQAMDSGGKLTIRTEADNGYSVVSIEDTGAGIPPDVMPHIFDPFFTTKGVGEGTGLGLSVSRGIVEQHGGIIEVDSKVGVGTTFMIKLPLK